MKPEKLRSRSLRALSRTILVLFTVNLFILALLIYMLFQLPGQLNQFASKPTKNLNDADYIPLERMVIFYRNDGKATCSILTGISEHRYSNDYPPVFRKFLPPNAGMVYEYTREDTLTIIPGQFQVNHVVVFASAEGSVLMILKPEDRLVEPPVFVKIRARYIVELPEEFAKQYEISTGYQIQVKRLTEFHSEKLP